jgi:hypothetical protein
MRRVIRGGPNSGGEIMAEKTYRAVGDTIEGDMISVECRKYTKWQL